jgi:parvulin-like peptidyl-prolyl isomerase
MGNQAPLDVRILALRLPQGGAKDALDERLRLADEIAARGKKGEDFCQLVASYSEDTQTKATCGSRGPQPMSALLPALQDALQGMHAGDVSDPVRVENEAVLVLQLVNDPKVPGFDDVKDSMTERAFSEAMDRQRKMWLQEMRRGVYVDVRL